jgi:hypothetical protein
MPAPHRLATRHALGGADAEMARAELLRILNETKSVPAAAARLGINKVTLHHWLTAWGVPWGGGEKRLEAVARVEQANNTLKKGRKTTPKKDA